MQQYHIFLRSADFGQYKSVVVLLQPPVIFNDVSYHKKIMKSYVSYSLHDVTSL